MWPIFFHIPYANFCSSNFQKQIFNFAKKGRKINATPMTELTSELNPEEGYKKTKNSLALVDFPVDK